MENYVDELESQVFSWASGCCWGASAFPTGAAAAAGQTAYLGISPLRIESVEVLELHGHYTATAGVNRHAQVNPADVYDSLRPPEYHDNPRGESAFLSGVLLLWQAAKRLSAGIIREDWTEEQLVSARKLSNSPAVTAYTWLLLAFSISVLVLGHILHFRWNVFVLIYSTCPLNWMKVKLRKPLPPRVADDWRQRPPIVSSHWGENPANHSGGASA